MAQPYRSLNYNLRPAKQIERRMIAEACLRLAGLADLRSFRYVGFGSIYFRDFIVFHKTLGLTQMVSIERDVINQERFHFNRPYSCIDLRFGESREVLPRLPWDVRTVLWLDYEKALHGDQLGDISVFCGAAVAPSVLIVSVCAEPETRDVSLSPLAALKERLGTEKVPPDLQASDFGGWGTARVYRRILANHVAAQLSRRNGGRVAGNKYVFRPLFAFEYRDGARMTTFGGLLFDEGLTSLVERCGFDQLEFVRGGAEAYGIEIPGLTYRELRDLDRLLPEMPAADIDKHPVPNADIERYARVYRFFPTFAETES